jgi:hypothetical protein
MIVLSGMLASGKTSVAPRIVVGAVVLSARRVIAEINGSGARDREDAQVRGNELEELTAGRWLALATAGLLAVSEPEVVVVDAARTPAQVKWLRAMRPRADVVYLRADARVRHERYAKVRSQAPGWETGQESNVFRADAALGTEEIEHESDLVIDTEHLQPDQVAERIRLGLRLG